ncbi:MAG TPA: Gfo/Idh/MocA family oxidoreductase [Microlunatus sp.]
MRRIGIIGIENSHTNHFLRHLNLEDLYPDARCTTIVRGTPERVDELTKISSTLDVVDSAEALVGAVDAAIICSRDGALHRGQAEPLLRAGIPVLIDKPLATTAVDAQALVELSKAGGAALVSASAVRFTPEVAELRTATGELEAVDVTGPADPDSPYSGIFFYGIHTVETAFELIGQPAPEIALDQITVLRRPPVIVVTVPIAGVAVTLRFVKPDDHGNTPFHAATFGRHSNASSNLTLGPDYNLPLLQKFMITISGEPGTAAATDLVGPIALTERIREILATQGS